MRLPHLLFAWLLLATPAAAHDVLANGEPVPDWIKEQCCGVADAHHLRPEQVVPVTGGYQIVGDRHTKMPGSPPIEIRPGLIPYRLVRPSPDGEWWVFYSEGPFFHGDNSSEFIYCVFGPKEGA